MERMVLVGIELVQQRLAVNKEGEQRVTYDTPLELLTAYCDSKHYKHGRARMLLNLATPAYLDIQLARPAHRNTNLLSHPLHPMGSRDNEPASEGSSEHADST